jgi:hypothetical protein
MLKYVMTFLAGGLLGGIAAAVIFIVFLLPPYAKDKYQFGHIQGFTDGQIEVIHKIEDALGKDYTKADGHNPVFTIKDATVVLVERNGVKTLRVYPN